MGTLTESMLRLRDEIVTLRQKRLLGQAELARVASERRAGVGAMRLAFSEDRAVAHRAWFGPNAAERRSTELQKERRLAEEARALAQAEKERRLAEEAKAHAQAEQERRLLAEEARALAQAERQRRLAEETKARAQAEQERKLAEEAKAHVQAERERKLAEEAAEEARLRTASEAKATLTGESVAAPPVAQAAHERNSSGRHPTSRKHNTSLDKASPNKPSKRHSSK